jgi:hypothetical protein
MSITGSPDKDALNQRRRRWRRAAARSASPRSSWTQATSSWRALFRCEAAEYSEGTQRSCCRTTNQTYGSGGLLCHALY